MLDDSSDKVIGLQGGRCFEDDKANTYPCIEKICWDEGYSKYSTQHHGPREHATSSHMMSQLPTEEVVLLIIDITVQNGDVNIFPTELLNT